MLKTREGRRHFLRGIERGRAGLLDRLGFFQLDTCQDGEASIERRPVFVEVSPEGLIPGEGPLALDLAGIAPARAPDRQDDVVDELSDVDIGDPDSPAVRVASISPTLKPDASIRAHMDVMKPLDCSSPRSVRST